jgi:Septum formation
LCAATAAADKAEIPDWDLAPNVEWLVQQIFEVYPRVTLGVDADRIAVTLYKENQSGTNAIGVDRETAERTADELRERLGNRSVCGIESPSTTTTSESPTTAETGSGLGAEDLRIGDCFNDSGHSTPEVGEITRVDCGSPHDAEVFGLPTLPGEPGAPYPGDDVTDELSDELCLREFASYVGIDYQDSKWEFAYIPPDEVFWNKYDDRLVVCSLNDPSFNKIEGSKRGTGT